MISTHEEFQESAESATQIPVWALLILKHFNVRSINFLGIFNLAVYSAVPAK